MPSDPDLEQVPLLTSPDRLQKIDQLREKNLSSYVPLPQLVAVGDQSSGKSSLLESLTGIPFPTGQELCTRYATQITQRREDYARIDIGIIAGPNASEKHKGKLKSYHKQVLTTAQLHAEFPQILKEVNKLMSIRCATNPAGDNTFSEDVLKIEKFGPNEGFLTIIDVPGMFRNPTEGVTTRADTALVRNILQRYIKDSRTIILAVLPSNVDIATQEILSLSEEADPPGDRTLGILTKVDLLQEETAKDVIVSLAQGTRKPLKLGYHLVVNRGGDDKKEYTDQADSQRQREVIFQTSPFSTLARDRVGVAALRQRLEDLLGEVTDRAFPKLRTEIFQKLTTAENSLEKLGASRQSEREQQQFLVEMAGKFQFLVRCALDGSYALDSSFDKDEMRLITAVVNMSEHFNNDFYAFAKTYSFGSGEEPETRPEVNGRIEEKTEETKSDTVRILQPRTFKIPDHNKSPGLFGIINVNSTIERPKQGIMRWIETIHQRSRGLDLGSNGQGLLASVFREQSVKWESVTKQYLSKIILYVHRFIKSALEAVCDDKIVLREVCSKLLDDLVSKYSDTMKQGVLLVNVERQLEPYTLNHYFNDNQQKSAGVRTQETLRPKARREISKNPTSSSFVVSWDDIVGAVSNKSNAEHAREVLHDTLEAYYQVAYKRFVDNVFRQIVQHKLLSGPESPLKLFSETWVLGLDAQELRAIAGESRHTMERRDRLKKEIEDLKAAVRILCNF